MPSPYTAAAPATGAGHPVHQTLHSIDVFCSSITNELGSKVYVSKQPKRIITM